MKYFFNNFYCFQSFYDILVTEIFPSSIVLSVDSGYCSTALFFCSTLKLYFFWNLWKYFFWLSWMSAWVLDPFMKDWWDIWGYRPMVSVETLWIGSFLSDLRQVVNINYCNNGRMASRPGSREVGVP